MSDHACSPTFEEHIALDVGGDLDPEERHALQRHLEGCAACRAFAAEMAASQAAWLRHGEPSIDVDALGRVRDGVLREIERPVQKRRVAFPGRALTGRRPRRATVLGALGALAAAALLVLYLGLGGVAPRSTDESPVSPVIRVAAVADIATEPPPSFTLPEAPPPLPASPSPRRPPPPTVLASAAPPSPTDVPTMQEEPMVVKLVSDEIVIYWLVDPADA